MNLKKELKFLYGLDKRIFKNAIKETIKTLGMGFVISITVLLVLMIVVTIMTMPDSDPTEERAFLIMSSFFYIFMLGLLGFMAGSMSMNIRGEEMEFLLPKPISTRGIILKKIIYGYVMSFALVNVIFIFILLIFSGSEGVTPFHLLQIYYGGLTLSFIMVGLGPIIIYHYKKLKPLFKKILDYVLLIAILIITLEFFIIVSKIFIYGYDSNFYREILFTTPLNVFLAIPLSSYYICVSRVYDDFFWVAVIVNTLLMVIIFYASFKYNYRFHEEFAPHAKGISSYSEREVSSQKKWWRRWIFKDWVYDYPKIRPGSGAIMEKDLLAHGRFSFHLVLTLTVAIFFVTFLFSLLETGGTFVTGFIFPMGMMMFLLMTIMTPIMNFNGLFEKLKPLPINGKDIAIYTIIPMAFYVIVSYWGWILFLILIGLVHDLELIFILFWMGTILLLTIIAGNRASSMIFSNEDALTGKSVSANTGFGSVMVMGVIILFTIFIHMIVSRFIDNILKFLLIGLADLSLVPFFIWVFGREYDGFARKKRRMRLRIWGTFFLVVILSIGGIGSPLADTIFRFDDTPTSWDVRITNDTVFENQEIIFDDYLYITSKGNLIIENSTILFDNDFDRPFGLYLAWKGKLAIRNSTLTSLNSRMGFKFILYGTATIDNCTIRHTWGRKRIGNDYGGLEINSDDVVISNTHISDSITNGIYCDYASPTIINVSIYNCEDDGVELDSSSPIIKNSRIIGNKGDGIHMEFSNPEIINNTINRNHMVGIHVYKSGPTLRNNEVLFNHLGDIDFDD
jgi:parallel beta-helix repeat protein